MYLKDKLVNGVCMCVSADGYLLRQRRAAGTCSVCVCVCNVGVCVAGGQRVRGVMRLEMAVEVRLGSAYQAMLKILTFILKVEVTMEF